jgi:DNA-binding transcriptional MerR regulator
MSERIFTLFGEEIIVAPEQIKAVGKSRTKKSKEKSIEGQPDDQGAESDDAIALEENDFSELAEQLLQEAEGLETGEKTAKSPREPKAPVSLPADWEGEKQYYTIGEVAALFSVRTSHIRFWTNEFKLKVRTTRKGDRLYTAEQIKEIRAIHHLVKERGFTLTGAKAKLKAQNKMDVETVDLKQSLLQLRSKLVIIRNQLVV